MEDKKVFLQIRIEKSLKEEFQKVTKDKAINSSELIRQFISKWVKEHKK